MACKPKNKMSPAERAKQFMPFAALHGLNEALENKLREVEAQYSHTCSIADSIDPIPYYEDSYYNQNIQPYSET